MTSVPKFIRGCVGLSVEREITLIEKAIKKPKRPFVSIIGGAKADKLNAVENLIKRVDKLLVGGALGFMLLHYFGKDVGETKTSTEGFEEFRRVLAELKNSRKLVLPVDAVLAERNMKEAKDKSGMALDIGAETIKLFKKEISCAKTIIWNGPMGMFELERFAKGTKEIAKAVAAVKGVKIVGGGDSEAAVNKFKLSKKMSLVSSGGGASLALFEGKKLVAIEALRGKGGEKCLMSSV
jgi:3-phosphoglycerate kinase